jgi:hypothetical protein
MTDKHKPAESHREPETMDEATEEQDLQSRREFLIGLGKWSRVVIAGAVFGGAMLTQKTAEAGWINRGGCCRGGSWVDGRGSGGSWANRNGGGYGGSWVNRR